MVDLTLKAAFLRQLREQDIGEKLFAHLLDIYFFVKNRDGVFVMANRTFVEKLKLRTEEELIGLTDFDVFSRTIAEGYVKDDNLVLQTGREQINKVELIPGPDGSMDWYSTTKLPLLSKEGQIVGLAGITRDLKKAKDTAKPYLDLGPVISHIMDNFADPLSIEELAEKSGLSETQFVRRFKKNFHVSPMQYLVMVRINAACQLLAGSQMPISDIALETGFYDHSYFTKQFLKHKNSTPKKYRQKFSESPHFVRNGK